MHRDDLASTVFGSDCSSSLRYPVPAAARLPGMVSLVPADQVPAPAGRLGMAKAFGAIASLAPWLQQIAYQSH